jgi:hypothetical protein
MMTQEQYENFWNTLVAPLNSKIVMPSYYAYLQREVYFQDYLDLFIKTSKNEITFSRSLVDGVLTVELPITLNGDNNQHTRIDENGVLRLVVEHDFPFSEESFNKQSVIKYVLIGEAAPSSDKYIYKDASGSYITAPLRASGIKPNSFKSFKRLEKLAESGYILLDLYPFSFDFNSDKKLRKMLAFCVPLMQQSILNLEQTIHALSNKSDDWEFCFVAPETTSMAIIERIIGSTQHFSGQPIHHQKDLLNSPDYKTLTEKGREVYYANYTVHSKSSSISHVSKHARLTTIIGGNGPHYELLYRALF